MTAREYVSPDDIYSYDDTNLTFLYHTTFGLDYDHYTTHPDLLRDNHKDWMKVAQQEVGDDFVDQREWIEKYILFGRAGEYDGDYIISFWNSGTKVYDMLAACLKELGKEIKSRAGSYKLIPDDVPVGIHTPHGISEYNPSGETKRPGATEMSPEQKRRYELQKKMHLMRGQEKQEAMKELGLWNPKKAQHPWQRELEKAGEVGPGQKWWAQYSEQIENIARSIDEDI
jgi:hypothetical protein